MKYIIWVVVSLIFEATVFSLYWAPILLIFGQACWFNPTTITLYSTSYRWEWSRSNWAVSISSRFSRRGPPHYLLDISSKRDGAVGFGGSTFKEARNRKVSLNGPTLRNNCVTTIFREKSLQPMINSKNFSFSEKVCKRKFCLLTRGVTCVKYV